jgi:hypothetical protein
MALSVEVRAVAPPQGQLTLIFPKASGILLPLATKAAGLAGMPPQENKVGKRTIQQLNLFVVRAGWWDEGDNAVFVLGNDDPSAFAKRIDDNETGLAKSALYQQVASFKDFTVWSRGFVDIAGLAKLGGDIAPGVDRLLDDVGLKSMKSVTFVSGFDGNFERSVAEIDIPGPRKGILALAGTKKLSLADLPPLPDDVTGFAASNFNAGKVYDAGLQIVEAAVRMFAPDQADNIKEGVRQLEGILGVKLGDDLFGSFDDMMVRYSSSSDGPPLLGGVYLFKVKHEKKLRDSLDSLIRAIPQIPNVPVEMKKRSYHGVDVHVVQIQAPGSINAISFAVHKGWFVLGNYPQGVYGYILRANGELPTWKADAKLTKALEAFPKEFTGIKIQDPRPTVQTVFSLLPPALTLANGFTQFVPGLRTFDVSMIPHAQDATRHLFPNITVTTDDGKKIRAETRASLALPF